MIKSSPLQDNNGRLRGVGQCDSAERGTAMLPLAAFLRQRLQHPLRGDRQLGGSGMLPAALVAPLYLGSTWYGLASNAATMCAYCHCAILANGIAQI